MPPWLEDFVTSMLSPSGNTAWHLAIVSWVVFSFMVVRAAVTHARLRRSVSKLPLRIGGWGSRGKSGTERLKAALLHAIRCDVVVKTTGCEAMMIHARRDRSAREIFLYRPYDKATIWEQDYVVESADRLGARAFLWECMALQPRFVSILIDEWMQDPMVTLTNAYPDHEDIMGPSGEDVARVISTFMPKGGVAFTSEDQMLPLVRDAARRRNTELVEVSPLDAALLPLDLLDRFPYREHPANIALVLAVAEYLGIDRTFALVKIADHVVPDLGVLKTYPKMPHRGRWLTFSNGMSANERAGFLSNWTRLELDRLSPDDHPEVALVAVVNNRADRVPRSRVFAELLTRDAVFDKMILIGTNVGGLQRFLHEEFERWLSGVCPSPQAPPDEWLDKVDEAYRHLRISVSRTTLERRLLELLKAAGVSQEAADEVLSSPEIRDAEDPTQALLSAVTPRLASSASGSAELDVPAASDALHHLERLSSGWVSACALRATVEQAVRAGRGAEAVKALCEGLRAVWSDRVVAIFDSHATGDQVIDRVTREVPPGGDVRILGCQNIKGTGLDFAYRWISVDAVARALGRLRADPESRSETLRWLMSHGDYGLLDARAAVKEISAILDAQDPAWAGVRTELESAKSLLGRVERNKISKLERTQTQSRFSRVLSAIEPVVDHIDSIRRSRWAARVMDDLFEQRVSQSRAAVLLREVTGRGKGGWLAADWQKWRASKTSGQRG